MSLSDLRPFFGQVQQGRLVHYAMLEKPVMPLPEPGLRDEDMQLLRDIVTLSEKRRAVLLWLAGENKRSKTAVLCRLSDALQTALYQVNCRSLVDEYGSQTGNVLNRLMADAESQHWLLFFDEADALFELYSAAHEGDDTPSLHNLLNHLENFQGLAVLSVGTDSAAAPITARSKYLIPCR